MTPNEFIIALSENMEPEEMNQTFSISLGGHADNITVHIPKRKDPCQHIYVEGWYKHERLAVCGIVMTEDGKMERR